MSDKLVALIIGSMLIAVGGWYLHSVQVYQRAILADIRARKGLWTLVSQSIGLRYASGKWFVSWARVTGTVALFLGGALLVLVVAAFLGAPRL